MNGEHRLPRPHPDSLVAATLLAFLATAGLFYVNIMPAIIDGLTTGLRLTTREAGLIGSANVYGAAFGALIASGLVARWPWRRTAVVLLLTLICLDLVSMAERAPALLIATRALHGCAGGMLVGFAFAVIARTSRPERAFGVLLIVQFGLGGLGVMFLPRLVPVFGAAILFWALVLFSTVTLAMLAFLPEYPRAAAAQRKEHAEFAAGVRLPLALALLAVFLFQAANMALFSFIFGLARGFAIDAALAARVVGASTWVGIIGSVAVIVISQRLGRAGPLAAALVLTAIGFFAFRHSDNMLVFVVANCGTSITWSFVMPYLFGVCAEFDASGRAAALGGFASKLGLASGPLAGALILGDGNYPLLIDLSAVAIVLCLVAAWWPARVLDQLKRERR